MQQQAFTLGDIYGAYLFGLGDLGNCADPTIQQKIASYANRYGINPQIALAQIRQESGCRSSVCSNQGACGIAQFILSTWAQYGSGSRDNVDASLDAWGKYMSHLLAKFGGDYRLALAGYHSGEGAARAALNNCRGNPRTCNYVNSIMSAAGQSGTTPPGSGAAPTAPDGSTDFFGGIPLPVLGVAAAVILIAFR